MTLHNKLMNIIVASALALGLSVPVMAQDAGRVVATCATVSPAYVAGQNKPITLNTNGELCTTATITPSATQDVNIVEIGGNAVTTTVPVSGTVSVVGTGTAGTANAGVVTVQGIAAMTPIAATVSDGAGALNVIVDSGTLTAVTAISNALPAGNNNIGDVDAIQSGTWTVQPGNTANTTPWLVNGISSASTNGVAAVVSTAVETGRVIKASAGNLYSVSVTTGAAAGRVLIHNSTTVPSAGAVTPVDCAIVAANSTVALTYNPPLRLGTGISVSFSTATTCFTQTDSATAFISGSAS